MLILVENGKKQKTAVYPTWQQTIPRHILLGLFPRVLQEHNPRTTYVREQVPNAATTKNPSCWRKPCRCSQHVRPRSRRAQNAPGSSEQHAPKETLLNIIPGQRSPQTPGPT